MELPIWQADAFTGKPFGGNPAAVCLLEARHLPLTDGTRQEIAAEMNLSETAFVEPAESAHESADAGYYSTASGFKLRWFTPAIEVPLCGHATLASAAVIFLEKGNTNPCLYFETLSGVLTVKQAKKGDQLVFEMDLPVKAPSDPLPPPLLPPDTSLTATAAVKGTSASSPYSGSQLGSLLEACVGGLAVGSVQYNAALKYLLVVLEEGCSREDLEGVVPDAASMSRAVGGEHMVGVIVTTQGSDGYDFLSRFFAPWAGIPEDPATGSAHAVLGPYWSARLGKSSMFARQCSPRGADVWVDIGTEQDRVKVSGQGVVVLRGSLLLPPQPV